MKGEGANYLDLLTAYILKKDLIRKNVLKCSRVNFEIGFFWDKFCEKKCPNPKKPKIKLKKDQ